MSDLDGIKGCNVALHHRECRLFYFRDERNTTRSNGIRGGEIEVITVSSDAHVTVIVTKPCIESAFGTREMRRS